MTIDEMKQKILKKIQVDQKQEETKINEIKSQLKIKLSTIARKCDELYKISDIVKLLAENNLAEKSLLYTDGVQHSVAFSPIVPTYFGVCGGGWSGLSIFVDTISKMFIVCRDHDEKYADQISIDVIVDKYYDDDCICSHITNIYKEIDSFIQKTEKLVSKL